LLNQFMVLEKIRFTILCNYLHSLLLFVKLVVESFVCVLACAFVTAKMHTRPKVSRKKTLSFQFFIYGLFNRYRLNFPTSMSLWDNLKTIFIIQYFKKSNIFPQMNNCLPFSQNKNIYLLMIALAASVYTFFAGVLHLSMVPSNNMNYIIQF
jgi:hypothetical protein